MSKGLARTIETEAFANDPTALAHLVAQACEETKAKNVITLDTSVQSDSFSRVIICSGVSDRQVQGIANRVMQSLAEYGVKPYSIEGLETGQWIVLDYGDVVAHLFYETTRSYYDLEGMWARAKRV